MMEVKVWVEGIQRVVCGVTEKTSCQDVVFALAHATGKVGRFTLVEKWRDNERLLSPSEFPLRVLHKWGEYSNDVQFILRHSDDKKRQSGRRKKDHDKPELMQRAPPSVSLQDGKAPSTAIKKSLTFSGVHARSNSDLKPGLQIHHAQQSSLPNGYIPEFSPPSDGHSGSHRPNGFPPDPVRNGLPPNHKVPKNQMEYTSPSRTSLASDIVPVLHNQKPNGHALPNGASPPRLNGRVPQLENSPSGRNRVNSRVLTNGGPPPHQGAPLANGSVDRQQGEAREHEELLRTIAQQSNRLKDQEARLQELDAGLKVLPTTEQESELELQAVLRKLEECELTFDEEIQELELVSWTDKLDLEEHQGNNLKSELGTLKENLGKLEFELKQHCEQVDKMSKDVHSETERFKRRQCELKASMDSEISVLSQELRDIESKKGELESSLSAAEKGSAECSTGLVEREMHLADLEKDLLQVNMENFSKVPSMLTVEGEKPLITKQRPGSARRLTSSPQNLADKVATARNPQGLWV